MNAQMAAVVRESLSRRGISLTLSWEALARGETQDLRGVSSSAAFDVASALNAAVVLTFPPNCVPHSVEVALLGVSEASARMELAVQRLAEAMTAAMEPVFVEDAPSLLDIHADIHALTPEENEPPPETPEQFNERMAAANGRTG